MITIYAPNAQDFSTLGLGVLAPYECTVEEQAGGMYELTMTHPMDAEGKWLNIGVGCIVKAPAPVRETPLVESEIVGEGEATEPVTVTRKIYKVQTNTGANLHLRQGPSTSTAILSKYRPGTEVVVLNQANGWGQVIVCSSGATGYMSMQYLVYVRDETETIEGDAPGPERVVYPVQSRMQLFRIFKVERDAAEREVRVEARHIFYDLLGNVVKNEYAPEGEAADAVVEELFERALNAHDFSVHCQTARSVTGEYTRRGLVECLLDPDDGVLPQTGARLVRDNFDVWILPDATRETGVTIRHGKNLLGATLTTDWDSLVTRIIPVGQDKEGKALLLEGTTYMDSPHIGDYPVICAQAVEYDVKIGQEGIDNAAQARAKLQELAEADFSDNGVDLPTVGLDVDFVALGETEEYRAYADLEAVHLYDTVRVIAKSAGIDAAVRVTGYKWDALGRKYEAVTLGEIADLKTTVYGYELQRGSVKTIKIAPGAVGSAQLRELAVQYAHINTAAVEQLSANSITALKAYIAEIVAGSVTTDELYAGIASIALAQITTANIENANIDWAQIGTLSADIATIAKAHLTDADIDWAQIANLTAAVAEIAQVEIGEAVIDGAQITDGTITNAKIENGAIDTAKIALGAITTALIATGAVGTAQIADGSITDAKIVSLNADVINAGTLSVDRLLLKGPDGLFVAINATDEGLTSEQLSQEEYQSAISGSVLVARSVTADKIAAKSITANEIAAGTITTAELAAESVDASKIKAGSITTSHVAANFGETLDISSNKQVEIIAGDVQQAQETADSAQEAAEQAAPYISATPPETAPEAGKLWLDEGVEPSVLRKWRGADVPTEREYTYDVQGCAKNLIPHLASAQTVDGVTYTPQADGTIIASGTCSGTGGLTLYEGILPPGEYTISGGVGGIQVILAVMDAADKWLRTIVYSLNGVARTAMVDVLSGSEAYHRVYLQPVSAVVGTQLNNIVISPQLETGDTATAFEPYQDIPFLSLDNEQGQIESVAVEAGCRAKQLKRRNLLQPVYITQTINGVTFTVNDDGSVTINGTATSRAQYSITRTTASRPQAFAGQTFTLFNVEGADQSFYSYAMSVEQDIRLDSSSKTFTMTQDDTLYIAIAVLAGKTVNNVTVYPQLELGSTATAYQPYVEVETISGRESVEVRACGKNLLQPVYTTQTINGVTFTVNDDGSVTINGTATSRAQYSITRTTASRPQAFAGQTFTLFNVEGADQSFYSYAMSVEQDIRLDSSSKTFTVTQDDTLYIAIVALEGKTVNNVTIYPQLELGSVATAYEPYRSMGGGTVTPTEPLYGLPGAEDTVEASVDGDVTVTRRTGYIASYNGESLPGRWISSHDVYAEGATPTTGAQVVYELAAPETEALTAISPIVPQPGQLNLATDADAITATIHGSGWETVNDTSSIQDALANLDGDLASLINEVGLLNGEVGSIAQQIISPDGIKNIVFESSEYQAMANTVELNANELSVTQATVTDINGRVETIEGTVRISGSNIDIGRSDSNVQLHLDNEGWSISESGQETIYARQNRVVAPRFQTTSLIFGALAFNSSGGHFRLMKYGG